MKGNPDPETVLKLNDTYSKEITKDIMSNILIIMIANLYGNTLEAFQLRLKGKSVAGSSFWQELGVIINILKIMPVIVYKMIKFKLLKKKSKHNTEKSIKLATA